LLSISSGRCTEPSSFVSDHQKRKGKRVYTQVKQIDALIVTLTQQKISSRYVAQELGTRFFSPSASCFFDVPRVRMPFGLTTEEAPGQHGRGTRSGTICSDTSKLACWRVPPVSTVRRRGAGLATASIEGSELAGDIRHPPAQMVLFMLADGLCRPPT
jgi:hypothetical protein